MLVIADDSKLVETLGAFDLPVEVNRFGLTATRMAVEKVAANLGLTGEISLRMSGDIEFVTDEGHLILDACFGRIPIQKHFLKRFCRCREWLSTVCLSALPKPLSWPATTEYKL